MRLPSEPRRPLCTAATHWSRASWGTIAARADRTLPPGVLFSDETGAWFAAPPEADEERLLTWFEVERIVLDAMTSPARPTWPRWVALS